ncbi:extensin family protein [Ruegeria sp. 2012CJ41-6]|uniref:Extensin family protein n=1 Tax=Ruegeria spongiae TaxID=2942209 RepID=A0ABT0Q4E3_9RHOB|nr:extensin family protein [Ruegeria spongiae]MCL6284740.1 extensin family protein [Ruegeria spongiae]
MTKRGWGLAAIAALVIGGDMAQALSPDTSPRPRIRPVETAQVTRAGFVTTAPRLRPVARPASEQAMLATARILEDITPGPALSLRPAERPKGLEQKVFFKKRKLRKTSVCGDIDIQGEKVGKIPGKKRGCGAKNAVRVKSVSGVMLSRPSLMTCETAEALNKWVQRGVKPAFKPMGRVAQLQVAAHYACRTRNNKRGAKISEHGKGKAIDISGFTLDTGRTITVASGWRTGQSRKALLRAWRAACGPFGTVLGPNADRYHQDHFHMDTARHRGGNYCR